MALNSILKLGLKTDSIDRKVRKQSWSAGTKNAKYLFCWRRQTCSWIHSRSEFVKHQMCLMAFYLLCPNFPWQLEFPRMISTTGTSSHLFLIGLWYIGIVVYLGVKFRFVGLFSLTYDRVGIAAAVLWVGTVLGRQGVWKGWWETLLQLDGEALSQTLVIYIKAVRVSDQAAACLCFFLKAICCVFRKALCILFREEHYQ